MGTVEDEQALLLEAVGAVRERIRIEAEEGSMHWIHLESPHESLEYVDDVALPPQFLCQPGSVRTSHNQCGGWNFLVGLGVGKVGGLIHIQLTV